MAELKRTAVVQLLSAVWLVCCVGSLLPAGGAGAHKQDGLHFVVYGDTRTDNDMHRKIVKLIMAQKPEFVLQTGDLVADGSSARQWATYDSIVKPITDADIPLYPARGNHDEGGPGYESRVKAAFTSGTKLYYSFDKGHCHFISVDSMSSFKPGSAQYQWLSKDLADAHEKKKILFVYFHMGPYSIGNVHGSDMNSRETLCPLFIKYGVRMVFNGHDHIYYHTRRNGITYLVSGGGGAPLYQCDEGRGGIKGDRCESVHHILVCDAEGNTITVKAIRLDGSQIETFTVNAL